jgi:hypothetical protein
VCFCKTIGALNVLDLFFFAPIFLEKREVNSLWELSVVGVVKDGKIKGLYFNK